MNLLGMHLMVAGLASCEIARWHLPGEWRRLDAPLIVVGRFSIAIGLVMDMLTSWQT